MPIYTIVMYKILLKVCNIQFSKHKPINILFQYNAVLPNVLMFSNLSRLKFVSQTARLHVSIHFQTNDLLGFPLVYICNSK